MGLSRHKSIFSAHQDKFFIADISHLLLADMEVYAVDEALRINQFPQFFENAKLNYAENILQANDDSVCLKVMNEENIWHPEIVTWSQLREKVRGLADALRGSGFRRGDVVVGEFCSCPPSNERKSQGCVAKSTKICSWQLSGVNRPYPLLYCLLLPPLEGYSLRLPQILVRR